MEKQFSSESRFQSIQWFILQQLLKISLGTILIINLVIIILSGMISEVHPWRKQIEALFGIALFSPPYFYSLGMITLIGILAALGLTLWLGYPFGRYLKKSLQHITDAADAFTRGRLDHRLPVEGRDEISQVGLQFNKMADRIENQVNSLQRLINENKQLVQQAEQAASIEERRKLARDLHDAVSQQLFAVSMTLSALPKLMNQQPEKATALIHQIEDMVSKAQQELRGLIMHLRPVTLNGQSLTCGIEQLLKELALKNPDIEMIWELDSHIAIEEGMEDQLFRVIQEALSNVLRHSKATKLTLKLYQKDGRILLTLEDNGVGFDLAEQKKSSYGLAMMKERIDDVGGTLELISYPGKGTRIEIRVPIQVN